MAQLTYRETTRSSIQSLFGAIVRKAQVALPLIILALGLSSGVWASPAQSLLNQNPAKGDRMGYSVSIEGDYAVVGTRLDDAGGFPNSGSVEIFKRDASAPGWHIKRC